MEVANYGTLTVLTSQSPEQQPAETSTVPSATVAGGRPLGFWFN